MPHRVLRSRFLRRPVGLAPPARLRRGPVTRRPRRGFTSLLPGGLISAAKPAPRALRVAIDQGDEPRVFAGLLQRFRASPFFLTARSRPAGSTR